MKRTVCFFAAALLTLSFLLTACAGNDGGQISPPDESGTKLDHTDTAGGTDRESNPLPESGNVPSDTSDLSGTSGDSSETRSINRLTMNDLYEALYRDSAILSRRNQGMASATALRDAGLSTLNTDRILDAVVDTDTDADSPYVLAAFRLRASTDAEAFATELYRTMDRTVLGDNCTVRVMHRDDIVLLCASTDEAMLSDFGNVLTGTYQMNLIEEAR